MREQEILNKKQTLRDTLQALYENIVQTAQVKRILLMKKLVKNVTRVEHIHVKNATPQARYCPGPTLPPTPTPRQPAPGAFVLFTMWHPPAKTYTPN